LHLEEIATAVAPGAHAILVLDQAGWHVSKTLPVPPNITLVPLPAKSPELNPVENKAVHARQLAFESRLQLLRGHPRPLLLRLEQADRPAVEDHINRHS
jgi:hypothetical protein